ncbi:MAG: SufD family Fe-S cluster assembly protein [Actinomycetota bacterium]
MTATTDTPSTSHLDETQKSLLADVGFVDDGRSATGVLVDQRVAETTSLHPDVEVLPIKDALLRYDWLQDLMFRLIDPDENEAVRQATELVDDPVGCFVYVKEGARIEEPIQLFSVIETPQARQFTHNITVIESGASVDIVSGAAVPDRVHAGHHLSLDECYVRDGANVRMVSIERWGQRMESESWSRTRIGAGATVTNTTIQLARIARQRSNSITWLAEGARNNEQMITIAPPDTVRESDSEIILEGAGAVSETKARMVAAGGVIVNRSTLVGAAPETTGFLGCDGLKLGDVGEITSVPALRAIDDDAQLSHEASVGKIGAEKLDYVMATGLDEEAARDLIVQGFLELDEHALPPSVAKAVTDTVRAAKSGSL